ncbi:hypothetical protein ACFY3M_50720 [Streptomyces mirabilis]|uniref:hypothetical protein n=1 Tax=Streptomyces mirabilis TaxID=68239 RepID=UPI00368EFE5C
MPVSPVPCAPGGDSTPGSCACAPSIASTPLCRADGTTVLVVIRSECVDCGDPAADPAAIGWIDPATGAYTAGAVPADVGPCTAGCSCSPSIATAPLCRADGTTVLVVVRSDCADCDAAASAPAVIGWIDPVTGVFTPGAVPSDVGPCTTDCIDTVCRQLCDDTDGDGAADATYSELYCIKADGTAELVLTYQDDPTVPYTPVAPVDCTYGCPESETVMLCDDTGPFLRRYLFLSGTATYEDVALDGQTPHVVTGTVGACTGTGSGPAGDACCAPSITSAPLCRADGTTVLLVVRSGCADCGSTPDNPVIAGWLDTAGTFTAGPPPADAGPCTAGCLDTVCRTRCDDTDGDGAADTTYSELWCIHADGSADLVLTYQDDPSTPYTPTAPVDCEFGPYASQALTLCDDSGPFLRAYTWTGGVVSFEDTELDGTTPHVVTGTAGICPVEATACAEQTTPAATLGLCLADGTPIAVVVTRDCDTGTVTQDGWINLTTGTYSAGAPPAGTQACGDSRSIQVSGTFCDVDTAGDVVGLVLIEYSYAADGTIDTVRLVDATTGTTYTPTGTITVCPADAETATDLDLTVLCDAQADGTVTAFVRDYRRDPASGQINGHTDYTLDGAPYTPAGTVGQCAEPCRNASTLLLCDLPADGLPDPTVTDTPGTPYYPYTTGVATAGAQTLWDGGTLTLPDAAGPQPGTRGTVRTAAAIIQAPRPVCDAGTAHVKVQVDVTQLGPDTGCRATGFLGLYDGPGDANRVALALAPPDTPVGWAGTLTAEADVPAADLAAGNIVVVVAFDAYDDSGAVCPPPRRTAWQLSQFDATVVYDQTGCAPQFLRSITTDCETGAVTAVTDTTLDGQPYTPTGAPGQCTPASSGSPAAKPCGDTEIAQLCDLTYDPQAPIPTPAGDFTLTGNVVAADGTTLWFAQANQPANGVAELTVSGLLPTVRYEFRFASAWIGAGAPDPANNNAIYLLEILDGATVLAARNRNVSNGSNVFPGGALTEDLPPLAFIAPATGAVTIRFTDQTTGGPVNDRDLFLMPLEVRTEALTVKRTPFLRRFTFGCDGDLTSTEDLALDGITPYAVQGDVGSCAADGDAAGTPVTPCDVQNVLEACRCDDADGDGVPEVGYVELLGVDCTGTVTSLGTYTSDLTGPYSPIAPMDCDAADDAEGAPPAYGAQAHRVELTGAATWTAAAWPNLQSVTAVAHGGTGTITTTDGPSTLHQGEAATWSIARDEDARLTGPLVIAADTGTVTVNWTTGVQL